MPIRVQCQCGKAFAAPDHLAGKRVKCPQCSEPLAIPNAAAATVPSAPAQKPKASAPKRPAPAADLDDDPFSSPPSSSPPRDLFSEAGMKQAAAGTVPCPECGKAMAHDAVLCVNCGFHRAKGKKIHGVQAAASASADSHGDAGNAAMLLARAKARIEDERQEEAKTRSEGMPAWGYALLLVGVICLAAIFMVVGIGPGFLWAAYMGWLACGFGEAYYTILIIIHAFNKAPLQGVLVLLVPFYIIYYVIIHWNEVGPNFTMAIYYGLGAVGCSFLFWIGAGIVALTPTSSDPEASLLWQLAKTVLAV